MKTLHEIIYRTLIQRGYSIHWYSQFYSYALSGFQEMNQDVLGNIKTVSLTLNPYGEVKLPDDCIAYTKIGAQSGDKIRPFGQNKALANNRDYVGDRIPSDSNYYTGLRNYHNQYGEFWGRIYGYAPINSDSFRVDGTKVKFDAGTAATEVYVEYLAKSYSPGVATVVHEYAEAALIAFIIWKYKESTRYYGLGEKANAERQYYNELRKLRGRMNNLSKEEILRSVRSGVKQSVKG